MSETRHGRCTVRSVQNAAKDPKFAIENVPWAEASGEPLLLPGLLSSWPAVERWAGPSGLDRLRDLAGGAEVQVMASSSHVFYGDISRHQPATMSFAQLLDLLMMPPSNPEPTAGGAPDRRASGVGGGSVSGGSSSSSSTGRDSGSSSSNGDGRSSTSSDGDSGSGSGSSGRRRSSNSSGGGGSTGAQQEIRMSRGRGGGRELGGGAPHGASGRVHVYLAQQPLTGALSALRADVPLPDCLYGKDIASTNLWMCGGAVRSSLHYDPHHNLLALVAGRKVVTLVPPYLSYCVYPMTLTGDAPNHSQVPFDAANPAAAHPAYLAALAASAVVELRAGDALFLPEGWWHQVTSGPETTIAVNFWWRSALTELLNGRPAPTTAPAPMPMRAPLERDHPRPRPYTPADAHDTSAVGAAAAVAAAVADVAAVKTKAVTAPADTAAAAAVPPAGLAAAPANDSEGAATALGSGPPAPPPAAALPLATAASLGLGSAVAAADTAVTSLEPGPGLRNLFALRQLTRAAIEDIADSLLAAVPPSAAATATLQVMPYGPLSPHGAVPGGPDAGADVASAVQLLVHAIRYQGAGQALRAGGPLSAAPVEMSKAVVTGGGDVSGGAAAVAPRRLAPHIAGLLCRLRPGEVSALGLTECPVASALASLTARQLADALYDMCGSAPHAVSAFLVRCCRVPAVACLLTRTFDQLNPTAETHGSCTAGGELAAVAAEPAAAAAAGLPVPLANVSSVAGAVVGATEANVRTLGGMEPQERVASLELDSEHDAVSSGRKRRRPLQLQLAECTTTSKHKLTGCRSSGGGGMDGGYGVAMARDDGGAEGEADFVRRHTGFSATAGRELQPGMAKRIHAAGGANGDKPSEMQQEAMLSCDGTGGGAGQGGGAGPRRKGCETQGSDAAAGEACGGGGGSGGGGISVPSDYFQRLYGTVDDPDEVFRLLLEGRAALNAAARRVLMESVLS